MRVGKADFERHITEDPPKHKQRGVKSVLDYLTECYMDEYPVSSEEIKKIEKEMEPIFEKLCLAESDKLFRLVYDLCGSYERAAFREGVKVGLQFLLEKEK